MAVQTTRQRKLQCDTCGWIVRTARGPAAQRLAQFGRMPTCFCGCELRFADVDDAAHVADASGDDCVLHSHPDAVEGMARWVRAAQRETSTAGVRHQCGGCRRFVRAVNEQCRCGFKNDIRGRRNHGGYTEAVYSAGFGRADEEEMPF